MGVEGIPTIVSMGTETCFWTSPLYQMPEPVTINHASWELAASRNTPKDNFIYTLTVNTFDENQSPIHSLEIASALEPTQPRNKKNLGLNNLVFSQIVFKAGVKKDAAMYERHATLIGESIGTPLLRAVNLLEPIAELREPVSMYDIHSLQELLSLSSEYHLFEFQGQPLKK